MLTAIARFEFRYLLRNPLLWLTAACTFAMFFIAMTVKGWELGSEGGLLLNASYATLRNYMMVSVMYMFVTTSFVAGVIIRDDETGFGPIIRSTRITKFEYLIGRFLGAFAVAALCMLLVPLAMLLGSLVPGVAASALGPHRLADHLYGYFLIALPNLFIHSAIFFALATITRSLMATYLGVITLMSCFFTLEGAFEDRPRLQTPIALAEPFAARALEELTRYWTLPERNVLLPDFTGVLLYNRLLWVGFALACMVLAYAAFRFADQGISKRERKKQKLAELAEDVIPSVSERPGGRGVPEAGPAVDRAILWLRTKFEMKQVFLHPAFPVLMVWGMYTVIFVLITQRHPDWRPTYPTTLSLIPEIEDAFRVIPLIVAIYYAGELVWRERDRRVHELIDAAPIPNWAYVIPKTAALGLVFVAMLVFNVLAAVIFQLLLGFTDVELGKYLLWYVLPASFDALLLAALAIFIQALSPHKAVGWGIMTVFVMWKELNRTIQHNLLIFGGKPRVLLSDLNGAADFWIGAWTFRLYWGAFAILLLVAAHLLWRRGTEIRLMPRLALARRRLRGGAGWVGGAALLAFVATGAYAYYNTNVLNEYRTRNASDEDMAEYERRFYKYRDVPQPSLEELALDIDVYPSERRAVARGRYLLRNRTAQPVREIHVRMLDDDATLELTSAAMAGARLILDDRRFEYRIYHLDRPMQPGEERLLTFETKRQDRGFRNGRPSTTIVANGTFLRNGQLMPVIGMNHAGLHQDPVLRRKYNLPGMILPPKLEDESARYKHSFTHGWIRKAEITVSTDADQTPIAPGKKVSDVTRGGRRIARFVATAPIRPRFVVQSARYAEKHRQYRGVDLAVYYHPRHAWNVDRMLDAMQASLDYCEANFGPYQFDHFRIVEYPAYHGFAQAFAGTIPFSESLGFIADYKKPDTLDYVTGVTAHEFAHMWWPHQMLPAETQGYSVLVETIPQYSAHMVMKKLRGEDQIRRYLQFELDRYLRGRAWFKEEPPLARSFSLDHLVYRKGSMVMYLLQKRLGEDAVNRALRSLLAQYKFQWAPFPRTIELIAALRAEAKTAEDQALITDLFERITLYDLEVREPSAVRRPDGKWDVTVPVEARKLYADQDTTETETPLDERIEVGLFTAEPGRDAFDAKDVILMERHRIRSGRQVLKFVTDRKPVFAGVDPYNFYIDRDAADNIAEVR